MAAISETTEGTIAEDTWTDVETPLGVTLVTGQKYLIQNVGAGDLGISENASAPDAATLGHILVPREVYYFTHDASLNIYVTGRKAATTFTVSLAD